MAHAGGDLRAPPIGFAQSPRLLPLPLHMRGIGLYVYPAIHNGYSLPTTLGSVKRIFTSSFATAHVQAAFIQPQIQRPSIGTFLTAIDMQEDRTKDETAVAAIASGVGNFGRKYAKTGNRTNICRRYVP